MDNIVQIPLDKGMFALIDSSDFDLVSEYKWYARISKWNIYATASNFKTLHMHRLILGVTDPKIFIDHKNHNGLDNRKENIRLVDHTQNMCNKSSVKNSSSKFKGVYWNKEKLKWTSQIKPPREKTVHIGHFKSEIEAALAYNEKAKEFHGEFACLNEITSEPQSQLLSIHR